MKSKRLRAMTTVLVVLTVIFSMSMTAFAAGNTPTSDVDQVAPAITYQTPAATVSFNIGKDIVLFNVDGSQILEPNVAYTYEVAPDVVDSTTTTVTGLTFDQTDDPEETATVAVRTGIAGGVTLANDGKVTFGEDNSTLHNTYVEGATVGNAQDKIVSKNLTVNIDANVIYANGANKAGIYRYSIKDQTTDETLLKSGIKRDANYNRKLWLDVYTRYNADNSGLEVYGYVLFKDKEDNYDQSFEYDKNLTAETIKVGGYDIESETGEDGAYNSGRGIISDQYHTYNVEVKKVIDGALGDKNHNFPFEVTIKNVANTISGYSEQVTSKADFYYVVTTDGTAANRVITNLNDNGAKTIGDTTTSSALKFENNDNVLITGLPVNAVVQVTELNDTPDVYTASAKDTDNNDLILDNGETSKKVAANTGKASLKNAFAVDNTAAKDTITVKNTLKEVSPTNVVLRYAPYLFILGAAILLLVMRRRTRKDEE